VSVLAVVRPDSWDFPLVVHLLGATVLVGAVTFGLVTLVLAWRSGSEAAIRLGFRTLAWAGLPAWIVMYGGALWTESKEGFDRSGVTTPSWIDIGHITAEGGLLLLLIGMLLANLALRRARRGAAGSALERFATGLVAVVLIGYVVAIWAMTTKPS
jgi:hypothetical protein